MKKRLDMQVKIIPALQDNYIYVLISNDSKRAIIVDPGEAPNVSTFLEKENLKLESILLTHHHVDHTAGAVALKKLYGAQIIAPFYKRSVIDGVDEWVREGDVLNLFGEVKAEIWHMPGHTLGHIIYFISEAQLLFVGDVLFALGCGRIFEGTASQMWHALERIKTLPDNIKIYGAHEYTLSNARFALSVMPHNDALKTYIALAVVKREKGIPTYPTLLKDEKRCNPFLVADSENQFTHWRALKDQFS